MPETPPGQRAAQNPARAAVHASRALGKAATGGGALSGTLTVRLRGQNPYRITVGRDGGEIRTCLVTGETRPADQQPVPADEEMRDA